MKYLTEDEFSLEPTPDMIEYLKNRVKQKKSTKSVSKSTPRCTKTIDFVEGETGDKYAKPKRGEKY